MRYHLLSLLFMFWNLSASETIPTLHAQSFTDAQVDLPADLHGKVGVFVLGFSKKSSSQTKQWNELLLKDYGSDGRVAYYEAAVLADVPALIRGMVVKGIRNGMSPAERAHFVPILQNASKWKDATHYASPDDAYILVVDAGGQIVWRSHGPEAPDAYRTLKEQVADLQK